MRKAEPPARHTGFTVVEVIVVMGIIAILAAVMMPLLRGSNDSAMTAQCRDNMRNLAQGVLSYAQSNGEEGYFPSAGFYRWIWGVDVSEQKLVYAPHVPWISNYGDFSDLKGRQTKIIMGDVVSFTDSDEKKIHRVIENGAIWKAVGTSYEIYRCPVHTRNFKKAKGRLPGWSFMMNQEFGCRGDDDDGVRGLFGATFGSNITVSMENDGKRGRKKDGSQRKTASRSPDKVLLFAEVQGSDVEDKKNGISLKALVSGSKTETDAVLEYADEDMGFTHPLGKGRYGGNVAFADGHVDTITMPTDKSYLKLITRYLCQGYDVPHDGRVYKPTTGLDDR